MMRGESKRKRFVIGIKQQQERVTVYGVAFIVFFLNGITGQPYTQGPDMGVLPVLIGHLMAVRTEPGYVFDLRSADAPSLKELTSVQYGLFAP